MNVLVLIPARGGSKGLARKNLRTVAGISLVGHAARVGRRFLRRSGLSGSVLIDTDSPEIAEEGMRWGAEAPFLRPAELATDASPTIDSTLHALDRLEALGRPHDLLVLLQPTSPLRGVEDVLACLAAYEPSSGSVIAIVQPDHPPVQSLTIGPEGAIDWVWPALQPDRQRQQLPAVFRPSGSVYVSSVEALRMQRAFIVPGRTRGVVLSRERSIDIDSAQDLAIAEALARGADVARLQVGTRALGPGAPSFVIAEARAAADAKLPALQQLIDAAALAGADALALDPIGPGELSAAAYAVAIRHGQARGIAFLGPALHRGNVEAMIGVDVPALRLAPAALGDDELLARLAGAGKPLLLSTATGDMVEVEAALGTLAEHGTAPAALLCGAARAANSGPGGAPDLLTLMIDLRSAFGRPAGLHLDESGSALALAGAGLGAALLVLGCALDSPAGAQHLGELVRGIRQLESLREGR